MSFVPGRPRQARAAVRSAEGSSMSAGRSSPRALDALNLRERVFLFLAVMVVCAALVDSLWVSPARQQHQLVRQKFDAHAAEMRQLQDDLRLQALQPSAARQAREELARIRTHLHHEPEHRRRCLRFTGGGTSLPDVLVHFLRRYPAA